MVALMKFVTGVLIIIVIGCIIARIIEAYS